MNLNIIDKAVMYFDPEAGLRRSAARLALSFSNSSQQRYAAGQISRNRDDRNATTVGADALTAQYMVRMRARGRAQYRDHELAKRMVDLWVNHLIGKGVMITFSETDGVTARVAKIQNEMFAIWANSSLCDSTGLSSLAGLWALAITMLVRDGEALIRRVYIGRDHPDYARMAVPLKLQVLEPDFLDEGKNGEAENGNPIVMGIEYDKKYPDVRVAYWLFDQHPGERSWKNWGNWQSRRVPADEIIHLFVRDRNNSRGVTWFHPVLDSLQDLKEYLDALRMKAKIEACFSVIISSTDPKTQEPPNVTGRQAEGIEDYEEISPGVIRYARPGDNIHALDPSNSSGHNMLVQTLVRLAAIGMGLTYDQAYSDLTGANYSSLRSGKMEFNRSVGQKQDVNIRPGAERIAEWFVHAGNLKQLWKTGNCKPEATFDPPDFVDPAKDGAADRADIEMGLATFTEKLAARGKDFDVHMDGMVREVESLKKRFGDKVQHPFIQTLMKSINAATSDQGGKQSSADTASAPKKKAA